MDLTAFQQFAREHESRLRGVHPETAAALAQYESELGFPLPPSMKWLLSEYGYAMSSGVDNLEESVALTLRCRRDIHLPDHVFLVNDWNDGGLVFCLVDDRDNHEYEFIWTDTADIYAFIEGIPLPDDAHRFAGFGEWVKDRLAETNGEE
jgi:hypothetical protein